MRVVNRDEFLRMPEGTIYHEYEFGGWGEMLIKGKTSWLDEEQTLGEPHDFRYQTLPQMDGNWLMELEDGESVRVDLFYETRCGDYAEEQRYLVWEPEDMGKLVARLLAIPACAAAYQRHELGLVASESDSNPQGGRL